MNREGIRRLAAAELRIETSPYMFADTESEYREAVRKLGLPCVVKPIMSSSGKGQSVIRTEGEIANGWTYAQEGGRSGAGRVIVEGLVDFDYEITLLTVRHKDGISFCAPVGHRQVHGDYIESWQPQPMSQAALGRAREIAKEVTDALGGFGVFGVEMFISGDSVIFSEVSPRPHDTGMVTMISQELSEFALHARAILGLPIPDIRQLGPSASRAIIVEGHANLIRYNNLDVALKEPNTQIRLFGKPEVAGRRRMGVALATAETIEEARARAGRVAEAVTVEFG